MKLSKFYVYCALSIGAVAYMVQEAVDTHQQFYPTVLALTNSKSFGVAFANGCLAGLCLWCAVVMRLFFGKLQQNDRRKLSDFMMLHFVDTLIALSYFRNNLTSSVTVLFVFNAVARMFHHLVSTQQQNLDQTGQTSKRKVISLALMLSFLFLWDSSLLLFYYSKLAKEGVSVFLLLGLETLMMCLIVANTMVKLGLHQAEVTMGRVWEAKGILNFYSELLFEFTTCFLYIGFFAITCAYQAFPVHLIRELLANLRRTKNTVAQFIRYRAMTDLVEKKFKTATPEELDVDRTCAICYDEMTNDSKAKRLPCAHCFHHQCLRRWVERNTACPYCWQEFEKLLKREEEQQQGAGAGGAPAGVVPPAAAAGGAGAGDAQRLAAARGRQQPPQKEDELLLKAAYEAYLQMHKDTQQARADEDQRKKREQEKVVEQKRKLYGTAEEKHLEKPREDKEEEAAIAKAQQETTATTAPAAPGQGLAARSKLFAKAPEQPAPAETVRQTVNPPTATATAALPHSRPEFPATRGSPSPRAAPTSDEPVSGSPDSGLVTIGRGGYSGICFERADSAASAGSASVNGASNIFDLEEISAYREYKEDCIKAEQRLQERLERVGSMRRASSTPMQSPHSA